MSAKVWLVGAGPGDPELLTLKAVRALREADVVLIDDLVNVAILEHCASARVIAVGKRGGCRSTPQAFIHRLMLRYARQGKCVVRLKGGDPCIFGRGGEEADWLRAQGIEVELVNGITAGLAGATQCGISLTLRGVSRGVTLVTAHTQDGSSLNWQALAQSGTTLVVYMGVAKLSEIRDNLMAGGLSANTPVAMIENASLPHQRECRSTLAEMQTDALAFELKSPAILVIGEVAASAAAVVEQAQFG
ncbi:uroporphyrinogen-III C-methyltransferase [Pseudomonas sp. 10B1]|uniref:uroporphyrinogen-III C-methyltransferase n=1 Tax=unclassified Pseudomonas TaxID=196821 RepID=UPI002AB47E0C|nr:MULTISPECIES: uroporphyrinogen-III C-methyltransferase [unclassified Pseudomonas]MDY7560519.1 uroporphyrinogen-III C-methyltransferase [Pseudomonas sp. AB6]MEA9993275.1 uroporphyrinogen-III C-methyltransferase [Pseudomonas sp. AA4]MEB0088146.1 uroporphyrinogen-III C-methyltransferase [Pseudomonas sp. RTI1]MEB0124238.1 uroporphyrinogen-III C-methyltransferase [Pseudomonas sp. CCC1.2]MEB0155820.1 uroporphyrinogen-III C-methyltransferase [Pseudomonas sp. CCC4.3]